MFVKLVQSSTGHQKDRDGSAGKQCPQRICFLNDFLGPSGRFDRTVVMHQRSGGHISIFGYMSQNPPLLRSWFSRLTFWIKCKMSRIVGCGPPPTLNGFSWMHAYNLAPGHYVFTVLLWQSTGSQVQTPPNTSSGSEMIIERDKFCMSLWLLRIPSSTTFQE